MKKDILIIGFIILLVALLIKGTDFQTVDEYYLTHLEDINEDSKTVYLSISCESVLNHMEDLDEDIKSMDIVGDGIILKRTEYVLREGDTVFDLLERVVRFNHIQMEYQGASDNIYKSVYIQGINYLYEFSCGELSGWMYKVNGEFAGYGCSKYKLSDGDVVEWVYTCELGKDVGADFIQGEN